MLEQVVPLTAANPTIKNVTQFYISFEEGVVQQKWICFIYVFI